MKIVGHRGAAGEAPENTIAGALHALERGAEYMEIDLHTSADDQLVVIHDDTVNRTTGLRGLVRNYSAKALSKMDARRFGPPWPRKKDCGVVTLDKFLEATPKAKGYILEIKVGKGDSIERLAKLIAKRFTTPTSVKKCVIMSMDIDLLHLIRELAAHIPLGLIATKADILRKLNEYEFEHLSLHWTLINPTSTNMIRRKKIELSTWTVNDPQLIAKMRQLKVDNVITDYPSMAVPKLAALERSRR